MGDKRLITKGYFQRADKGSYWKQERGEKTILEKILGSSWYLNSGTPHYSSDTYPRHQILVLPLGPMYCVVPVVELGFGEGGFCYSIAHENVCNHAHSRLNQALFRSFWRKTSCFTCQSIRFGSRCRGMLRHRCQLSENKIWDTIAESQPHPLSC